MFYFFRKWNGEIYHSINFKGVEYSFDGKIFVLLLNFECDEYLFESKIFVLLLNFESVEYLFESKIFVLLLNFESVVEAYNVQVKSQFNTSTTTDS